MTNPQRYMVIADDIYLFANFENVISYFELWDDQNSKLFDSAGNLYHFYVENGERKQKKEFPLHGCRVNVEEGMSKYLVENLQKRGYIKSKEWNDVEDIFKELENRFGLSG